MECVKFLRIFGVGIVLSLLIAVIPAAPALAARTIDIEFDASTNEITVIGYDFNPSITTDRYVDIYLTIGGDSAAYTIGTQVTTYERVKSGIWIDEVGDFVTSFEVPDVLDDGTDDEDVESGVTYYVSASREYTNPLAPALLIGAYAEFTLIGGEIELDPEEGPVDSLVEIIGWDFPSRDDIIIEFDGDEIDIEDGDDDTDSSGEFASIIAIPESTAGDHTITVTVGGSEAEAEFTVEPDLIITPQSGESGTEVIISGTGFDRRQDVEIWFDDNIPVAAERTGSTGSFTVTFNVPPGLEAGIYDVDAEDGTNVASAKFTLTVAPPPTPTPEPTPTPTPPTPTPSPTALTINQSGNTIGSTIGVGGSGFIPNSTVTVKYDDTVVATTTADALGIITALFQAPPSKSGDHIITVSDGTSSDTITFTVESVAPPTPQPLLPEMGIKVESPVLFDWEDVTDESFPVTYTFQIATSKDFTSASLALEKTELIESEYTLTEGEELKLEGREAPYYWRVRAVDAALNEGEWTGAGEFFVATPFGFPSWALYTLLGIGAVLIFGIGYWLGRRTAFYY